MSQTLDKQHIIKYSIISAALGVASWLAWKALNSYQTSSRDALYSLPASTRLSLCDVQRIFRYFKYGDSNIDQLDKDEEYIVQYKELKGGLSNSNYMFLSNLNNKYLAKICEEKNIHEIQYQVDALSLLQQLSQSISFKSQLLIAFPLKTFHSDFVIHLPSITSHPIVFYQYLDGATPKATINTLARIGEAQAALHSAPIEKGFGFLPKIPMGMFQIREQVDKNVINTPFEKSEFIQWLQPHLLAIDQLLLKCNNLVEFPQGILHNDLFLENVIFDKNNDKCLGIIDFEEMGRGPLVLDVAMTVVGCCYTETHELRHDLMQSFLEAYQRCRPFTKQECNNFIPFLKYALIAIAYWRWQNFNVFKGDTSSAMHKASYTQMTQRVDKIEQHQKLIQNIILQTCPK